MAYGKYGATGAARRRADAAATVQRAARASAASKSRRAVASVARSQILSLAETGVLRRAYINCISRWNQPAAFGGILWTLPVSPSPSSSSGTHIGWHLLGATPAVRHGSEIYSKYIKFKVRMTCHESLNNIRCRWMLIEFTPDDKVTQPLLANNYLDAADAKWGASQDNGVSNNAPELDNLFIGTNGRGSGSPDFPRIHDTVNRDTRQKYNVLRDFTVDLSQGPPDLGQAYMVPDEHGEPHNYQGVSTYGVSSNSSHTFRGAQWDMPFTSMSYEQVGAQAAFTGGGCLSKELSFSVPYKRKVEYRSVWDHVSPLGTTQVALNNEQVPFTVPSINPVGDTYPTVSLPVSVSPVPSEQVPISRDLMWVMIPSMGDLASKHSAASKMLPLVQSSVYSEVYYSDP